MKLSKYRLLLNFLGIYLVSSAAFCQIPDLSRFTFTERQSLESVCRQDKLIRGPAAYANCLNSQILAYEKQSKIPDLSRFTFTERQSLESVCRQDNLIRGPAAYASCLNLQIGSYEKQSKIPDLSRFTYAERQSLESVCQQDKLIRGPAAYASCLNLQIGSYEKSTQKKSVIAQVEDPKKINSFNNQQSNLPECQGSDVSRWSNCTGEETLSGEYQYKGEFLNGKMHGFGVVNVLHPDFKGDKYVGEFKDDKRHGQGTYTYPNGDKYVGEFKDDKRTGQGTFTWADGKKYVGEIKDGKYNGQGILTTADGKRQEGIWEDNRFIREAKVNLPRLDTKTANNTERSDLERERQQLAEERRRLELEKPQREQERKASRIAIKGSASQPDANGDFTITIQTGADTASLKIDGEEVGGRRDGNYVIKRVARVGDQNSYLITARDVFGNTDSATVTVARQVADSRPAIPRLNPASVKVQQSRDAVAIIIGIENYRRVAKADFANADAKEFYTYASRALGIKPENIKLLVDDGADDIEMLNAFQNWLPLKVNKGKTDVYVFYSGHGYPSQDGNSLYFLPFNVDKQYLDRTSVKQKEVVSALQKAQAKSVTMFIDACYSGQTRGGEVLIAGLKPLVPKTDEKAYPPEFTVITASAADQFSSASQDLKHGIFSFYLMKGMEGDADSNKDSRITSGELQRYLSEMVGRQAMGLNRTQNTQLFGDTQRVLVGK